MTKLEALVGLNLIPEIGSVRLNKLLECFGTPENILKATTEKLTAVFGIGEKIASGITALKSETIAKEFILAERLGVRIITQDDPEYPLNLKNIYDPPIVLYVLGAIEKEDAAAIAIVGSRRASLYGLSNAEKFAGALVENGFTVVSGMARGIDTAAHRGALKRRGRTIAVIGSGLGNIYPPENKELCEEIAQSGAVISEFPVNTQPFKHNFPRRNRVISGISLGVLVAEAAKNSGALITADFALEQGREVFALPGKADSSTSFGTNELIKQGAKLATTIDDILEEFNLQKAKPRAATEFALPEGTPEETLLYGSLTQEPTSIDELVDKTSMEIQKISVILLRLRMKKLVQELPGRNFVRSAA